MNPSSAPIELQPLLERFGNEVTRLMQSLQNGMITADEWYAGMRKLLARYHVEAMKAGTGITTLPEGADDLLVKALDFQDEYLDNFRMVIEAAPEYNPAWLSRAMLYVKSIQIPYWEGDLYRQAGGKFIPMAFVPGQGTQCMNSDRCKLKVHTLDFDKGDWDVEWLLDTSMPMDEHCQTCLERAAMSPYRIRNGVLQI